MHLYFFSGFSSSFHLSFFLLSFSVTIKLYPISPMRISIFIHNNTWIFLLYCAATDWKNSFSLTFRLQHVSILPFHTLLPSRLLNRTLLKFLLYPTTIILSFLISSKHTHKVCWIMLCRLYFYSIIYIILFCKFIFKMMLANF